MFLSKIFGREKSVPSAKVGVKQLPSGIKWCSEGAIFPMVSAPLISDNLITQRDAYLQQLDEEGYITPLPEGGLLEWDALFNLLESAEHAASVSLLQLPPVLKISPQLVSQGSLTDPDFQVAIRGWQLPDGSLLSGPLVREGAKFNLNSQDYLLPPLVWQLCNAVRDFSRLQSDAPSVTTNQVGWAKIRKLAMACKANMDGFLCQTVVLSPDKLDIALHKRVVHGMPVIEVEPRFDGQPDSWMRTFDAYSEVQDCYHIAGQDGSVTHVLIPSETKSVLSAIRRMPGRRVAGDDALAFIRNPPAVLGEDAIKVIDTDAYEKSLVDAGICFYRFSLLASLNSEGLIDYVDLLLEPTYQAMDGEAVRFDDASALSKFVSELQLKLEAGLSCGFWQGYELNLADFDLQQLQGMKQLLQRWQQETLGQWFDDVFDPAAYGERVLGIGVKQKLSSPFLVREKGEDWLPSTLLEACGLDAELLNRWDTASKSDYDEFVDRIQHAEANGKAFVSLPKLEIALKLPFAMQLERAWAQKFSQLPKTKFEGKNEQQGLLVDSNIDIAPAAEQIVIAPQFAHPVMPNSLRQDIVLHKHQLDGIAWLQSLFMQSPKPISGALLADDMGLGKTLQLLTFISWYLEEGASSGPVLIVAPVSLLDNWDREFQKFFHTNGNNIMRLYGDTLSAMKLRRQDIPENLQARGIRNLLRPDWRGDANVVLTTYETLRDQELSLARQKWAIMVCDEAQKIKNPAAMVTQSAKALPVRFRIACTGTPVENSLTDLWCLFDFIQPGKLGSLNAFGQKYRRPIECSDSKDFDSLNELRQLISPQILRRTKEEVADLPPKIEHQSCRNLKISTIQDGLYKSEVSAFEQKSAFLEKTGERSIAVLGLLHTLRMICAHPHSIRPEGDLLQVSPKMKWLIEHLHVIRQSNEKAIIFTEFRELQREIKMTIMHHFGLSDVIIVNGTTKASSSKAGSRQGLIDNFQNKPGFGVIILSTTAVGFGVNIQEANHVIHFTRSWNPAKEDQATDRAYRIGQKKTVHVYYPTIVSSTYPTFEMKLDELLGRKRALSRDMLNGGGELDVSELFEISTSPQHLTS